MPQLKFCKTAGSDALSQQDEGSNLAGTQRSWDANKIGIVSETAIRGRASRDFNKISHLIFNGDDDWAKFERGAHFVTQSLRSWTKWQR